MNKLPNFICVGAQKAGTTSLHDILKQHPDIYLPDLKEAHFFDQEDRYKKGISWWINTFFNNYKNEKIMGVITPEYLYYEEVPDRILKNLGNDIKIIIILRNPIERAYSHYLMSKRRGFETMSFEEAIDKEKSRIIKDEFHRNNFSYISRGMYSEQVQRYLEKFDRKNILFLTFENDIVRNLKLTIEKIEIFLDIGHEKINLNMQSNQASEPRFKIINNIIYNKSIVKKILKNIITSSILKIKIVQMMDKINQKPLKRKEKISERTKKNLTTLFKHDIKTVSLLTKLDLAHWIKESPDNE